MNIIETIDDMNTSELRRNVFEKTENGKKYLKLTELAQKLATSQAWDKVYATILTHYGLGYLLEEKPSLFRVVANFLDKYHSLEELNWGEEKEILRYRGVGQIGLNRLKELGLIKYKSPIPPPIDIKGYKDAVKTTAANVNAAKERLSSAQNYMTLTTSDHVNAKAALKKAIKAYAILTDGEASK